MDATRDEQELGAKVAFLLRRAFAEQPEAIETHMSWVFLTPKRAYKLKKPLALAFLDNRTLAARRRDCELEVALNQPLAPGVYLGTVPLTRRAGGGFELDGDGPVADWLTVMRRLPRETMLDSRLAQGRVSGADADAIGRRLSRFYLTTERRPVSEARFRADLAAGVAADHAELRRTAHPLDADVVERVCGRLHEVVDGHPALASRAAAVVDGHGDVRPEHVVVDPEPMVIDRITFDRSLRLVDPLHDLAALTIECELLGAAWFGEAVTAAYCEHAGDEPPPGTVQLYGALRAATRARLSVAHLNDGTRGAHGAAHWLDRTDSYLAIAEGRLERLDGPRCTGGA